MMTDSKYPRLGAQAVTWLLAALLLSAATALAQSAPPATSAQGPSVQGAPQAAAPATQSPGLFPAQPPPADKPGFIYAFGHWWDSTNANANGAANATQEALNQAAQATKDAATALIRIPGARFIEVHQRCAVAPNGAPDCRSAAANVCRTKGFHDGNPVNVQSSQNCPPAVWMSGRVPTAGECPQETVVLMVACQ